jgi:transcriptional regulator with XRE-family HTH domain
MSAVDGLVEEVRRERQLPAPRVLKLIRQTAGVSQARVAKGLGVGRVSVARYELGTRKPRGALLARYIELLEALQSEVRL